MEDIFVGIDLGEKNSVATILSPKGEIDETFSFGMDRKGYETFRSKVPEAARITFEATGTAYPVSRWLRSIGYNDITVAHPKELKWIAKSKKKNDKIDSMKLAKLHFAGMIPESRLLTHEEQIGRDVLIQRVKLGVDIGQIKNSIIGYLKREGVYENLPKSRETFSVRRVEAMKSLKFGDQRDLVLKSLLDRIQFLEEGHVVRKGDKNHRQRI